MHKTPNNILHIDKIKLDETFPDVQFMIENYKFQPFRRDRNKKCVWDIEDFEIKSTETICIELLMSKRKWCIIFTYRPSKYDKKNFFQELSKAISQAINMIIF